MIKSGVVRLVLLILFFLFMILYVMQLTGYNEYQQNSKNLLTEQDIKSYENDVSSGVDVTKKDYTKNKEKNYNNSLSSFFLSFSKGIGEVFNESMNTIFKMLEEAVSDS